MILKRSLKDARKTTYTCISDTDNEEVCFIYVVCHGAYSWPSLIPNHEWVKEY